MMKVYIFFLTLCSGILLISAHPAPSSVENDKIDNAVAAEPLLQIGTALESSQSNKLSSQEQAMLEQLLDEAIAHEEYMRQRRKSADVKQVASNRLSSSYDHDHDHHDSHSVHDSYGPPPKPISYDHKAFSIWSFKKAIFSALLQAVKAITGGVLAVKGQLIKVKGHIVAAKGKLMETKGDALTEFGKHIATKALLTPVHSSSSYEHGPPAAEYGPYAAHSGHSPHDTSSVSLTYSPPLDVYSSNAGPSAPTYISSDPSGDSYGGGGIAAGPPPSAAGDTWSNQSPPQTDYADISASPPHSHYGPPPPSVSHYPSHSYGPPPPPPHMSYGGPPATSYGVPVPSHGYGAPPSPYDSYSQHGGGGGGGYDSWGGSQNYKRDTSEKKADSIHAGLIILKPAKITPSDNDSVYQKPKPFSKKSDNPTDEKNQTDR